MPGTPITPQAFAALMGKDLRQVFREVGQERPREYPLWINVDSLDHNPATDQQVIGLGPMTSKPIGQAFPRQTPTLGGTKQWEAAPFGSAVELTFEGARDEQYTVFRTFPADQARAGREREELAAISVLDNAFDTNFAGFTSGESLCSTAHVGTDGVTRANRPNPDVGFSITGVQQAILHFHGLQSDAGLRMLMNLDMFIMHANNLFAAREILGSSGKPFTGDNEINSLVVEGLRWLVSHFLSSLTAWFGVAPVGVHDMWFMWRDQPFQDTFADPNTLNVVSSAYQRHTNGEYRSWRGLYGSTG